MLFESLIKVKMDIKRRLHRVDKYIVFFFYFYMFLIFQMLERNMEVDTQDMEIGWKQHRRVTHLPNLVTHLKNLITHPQNLVTHLRSQVTQTGNPVTQPGDLVNVQKITQIGRLKDPQRPIVEVLEDLQAINRVINQGKQIFFLQKNFFTIF